MKRNRRRLLLASAILTIGPLTAACGFNAQTEKIYQPAVGTNDYSGSVDILNAVIISGEGSDPGVFGGTLVNNGNDDVELTGVSGDNIEQSAVKVAVPAGDLVNLADDPKVRIAGDKLTAGDFVKLDFTFSNGDNASMYVPVVNRTGDYADLPTPAATPTTSDSATPTDGATPSDAATQ